MLKWTVEKTKTSISDTTSSKSRRSRATKEKIRDDRRDMKNPSVRRGEYGIQNSPCPQPFVNTKSLFSFAKHLPVSRAANSELRAHYDHNTLSHDSTELRQVIGGGLRVILRAEIKKKLCQQNW